MRAKRSSIVRALLCLSGTAVIGLAGGGTAGAQTWEANYGGSCSNAGRSIQAVSVAQGSGYIAVGDSKSNNPNCQTSDIYVVRTNNNGAVVWARTYDIGGWNDSATCIKECHYGTNTGFIITGVTNPNNQGGCAHFSRDAFLLKIDVNGNPTWVKTYGLPDFEELATSVTEMSSGNPNGAPATHPGDFIFCGTADSLKRFDLDPPSPPVFSLDRDAYMVRTDNLGNVIWGKTYAVPNVGLGDAFMSVCESFNGSFPNTVITAGNTDVNFTNTIKSHALVARINALNGAVVKAVAWGSNNQFADSLQMLYDVQEMQLSSPTKQIVVVGMVGNRVAPFWENTEIYAAKLTSALALVAQTTIGDNSVSPEAAYSVREAQRLGSPSDLVLAGYAKLPGGFGDTDAVLTQIHSANLAINFNPGAVGFKVYGADKHDEAYSVVEIPNDLSGRSAGYAMAGFYNHEDSIVPPSVGKLYMIKTDLAGQTPCNPLSPSVTQTTPTWVDSTAALKPVDRTSSCTPPVTWTGLTEAHLMCYDPNGIPGRDPRDNQSSDGIASVSDDAAATTGAGNLLSFPNPVTRGNSFTVEWTLAKDADVVVEIADMAGRTIHTEATKGSAGDLQLPVSTAGWSAGVYVVKVTVGGNVMMRKIVVSGK
jgi:hypothetical protein